MRFAPAKTLQSSQIVKFRHELDAGRGQVKWFRQLASGLPVNRQKWGQNSLRATAICEHLSTSRLSRLLTLWTRKSLELDMALMSALAQFVQWYWRRRLAFRNRVAPHVFVKSRRREYED